ncbi:hypothetical protein D3C86_1984970 [compost metagenome]
MTVLLLVDLLEQRALIPRHALEALHGAAQFVLRDIHEADTELLVGLCVGDQVVQPAPRAFQLLEVLVMQDEVDLLR